MKFSNYLDEKLIFMNVEGSSMNEIIRNIIEKLAKSEKIVNERKCEILKSILKREEEISTAIGKNVAVPHARIENFNDLIVVLATVKEPYAVNIASTSKVDKVKIVFLIISDILKNKNILKILSAISKLATKNENFANNIKEKESNYDIMKYIKEHDIEIGNKITAEDVLSPDITPVMQGTTLEEIAKRIISEKRAGFPVVNENLDFLGEITEKELISFGMPKYLSLMKDLNFFTSGVPFEEYLKNEKTANIENLYRKKESLHTIDKCTPIMEICFIMLTEGITRLYVVENDKYIGMIERADIIKKILHL